MILQTRTKLSCNFCGHIWLSQIKPKKCPRCHNDWRKKPKNGNKPKNN